ncbi:MAG: glycosyltransferase [Oliverpabstia sp.]|nr:glycosyltransferase [Oliverpabstia sp.]
MSTDNKKLPTISVIMGIYNCAATLSEAVECILNQTFTDWELIMCDDGSQDDTYEVAKKYADKYAEKIILLQNKQNKGLNYTLNRCLALAKGSYIARMDGDDHCSENRFEVEMEIFRREPEIDIVSTDMQYFDETGIWGNISHPTYPTKKDFLSGTPFCHAPCLVKKKAFLAVGGYSESEKLLRVEDYHLWVKMYKMGCKGKNVHIPLYQMRDDRNAYGRRKFKYRLNEAYVKAVAVKELELPIIGYIYALRPILVGLLPPTIYDILHKKNLGNNGQ